MSEDTNAPQQLTVLNRAPQELVVAQRTNALSRLFQLKPKTLELVSKSTRQEGAIPGTFRVTSTNESFKELRAVILFEPIEQREKYRKGEYTRDSKECFSLDNVQPHPKARTPYAMYCANCPMGDNVNWPKYREAKAKGLTGDQLAAYLPPCRKFWHLFIASRETQRPYYFNVKGTSVKPFEDAMQNVADLFQMIYQNTKAENKVIAANNAKLDPNTPPVPLKVLPTTVGEVIWHISFTMYARQINGGPFFLGLKDFKVMSEEDRADFGRIIDDVNARRNAGQLQTQEASEAEEEAAAAAAAVSEPASGVRVAEATVVSTNAVAEANAKIEI
jgi:hypothetical protein